MAHLRGRAVPVYVGDDRVDEPAFSALSGGVLDGASSGVTVRVGSSGLTRAQYHLSRASEVRSFLNRLRREFA